MHAFIAKTHQRGSVLIVSLMILLVLTLIGVTALGTSTLEEKMANNSQDQSLAFQAAEAALLEAQVTANTANLAVFNNTGGFYDLAGPPITADNNISNPAIWTGTNSRTAAAIPGIASQARYILEIITKEPPAAGGVAAPGPYGSGAAPGPFANIRITVRATGGTDNAVVMLQGHFARQF